MAGALEFAAQQLQWQRGLVHVQQREWQQAADCFVAIAARTPDHVPALLKAAHALLQIDRYRDAHAYALKASEHLSAYPGLLVEACQTLRSFNESRPLLDLVAAADLELYAGDAVVLAELASLTSSVGDQVLARRLAELAVVADPAYLHARYMRGIVALFQGEMSLARTELETCLQLAPGFSQAYWVLSGMERVEAPDEPHLQRLRHSVAQAKPGSAADAYLSFALHNESHASGQHEIAWQALQRGCAVQRALAPYEDARQEALMAQVKSMCTPDFVVPVERRDALTPIFIVGMHRSGTTLLERILAGHSQIADGGETYAFTAQMDLAVDHKTAGALDATTTTRLAGADFEAIGAGFIRALHGRAGGRAFVTEKLPSNFINIGFIAKALPNAKILHMVRDPMDTCFSNLRTYFNNTARYSYDQLELARYYGQYRELMAHWHAVMPGRILDVAYADLVADSESTARRIFDYCGLPFEAAALHIEREAGAVATASSAYVRKGILRDRGAAWKPYAQHLQPLQEALARQGWHELRCFPG